MAISLKALVDQENKRVIFAESNEDFIDVLFSFLTMPMGTIIRLTHNRPPPVGIGCMTNLYRSVENLEVKHFWTEACKTMLLDPQNGAASRCQDLKLSIDDGVPLEYFCCSSWNYGYTCTASKYKLLSRSANASCGCGSPMNRCMILSEGQSKTVVTDAQDGGVFVKGMTRFVISDELDVMPPSTAAAFPLLFKFGIIDASSIEQRTFNIGVDEVLDLLKCSLVSKMPLTDTLLKHEAIHKLSEEDFEESPPSVKEQATKGRKILSEEDFEESSSPQHQPSVAEQASKEKKKICVRLVLSKSKNKVCYAEVSEDFVDLLCSFLTIPLGYMVKEMHGASSKGCIDHLYKSVECLDHEKYLKSNDHKKNLLSPKIASGFGYENQPLDVEEVAKPKYYYILGQGCLPDILTTDKTLLPSTCSTTFSTLTLMDPRSPSKKAECGGGFVIGPTMFTVTDDLIITPISPLSGLCVLSKLSIAFNDTEEIVVHVGNRRLRGFW